MAKILVADDNSNVQKTVALALADLGVEVVSVNNGEAAVRKLSGYMPDLVLADIFMPVRNGYEVCEFVKKDSRFSKVPVVLLVGAFDPLDEREAQRVGADGILKKPFVPPDPLITMVKTLLDRTLGDRLVGVVSSVSTTAAHAKSEGSTSATVTLPAHETSEETSSEEFPAPAARVSFGDGEHPVAFGTLLDTPAEDVAEASTPVLEPVDDEQVLTSQRDANLGDPIFWKSETQEAEAEGEPADEGLPEKTPTGLDLHSWKEADASPVHEEEPIPLQPVESLELVREETEGQAEAPPSIAESGSILLDQAAQASLTVETNKPEDLAANPIEWMATAPPQHTDEPPEPAPGWDEPIPDVLETIDVEALDLPEVSAQVSEEAPVLVVVPILEQPKEPPPENVSTAAGSGTKVPEPAILAPQKTATVPGKIDQSATETVRSIPKQDWAELAASLTPSESKPAAPSQKIESAPAAKTPAPTGASLPAVSASLSLGSSPDPALVEAVVQRVLEKMRPQVVDIITKEFLRPIVQALVHREIEKH